MTLDLSKATRYQQVSYKGQIIKNGERRKESCPLIDWDSLKGKTVLDLGCNNGMVSIRAKEAGASRVVGVDFDDVIFFTRELVDHLSLDIELWRIELNSTEFLNMCPQFDIVFCCSVFTYMKDKPKFLMFLDRVVKEEMYFETNYRDLAEPILEQIKTHTTFATKVLGHSDPIPAKEARGHFLIHCTKDQHWLNWPVSMVPLDLLQSRCKLEDYKLPQYAPKIYGIKVDRITELADDIEKYGLKEPLFVIEFLRGPFIGNFHVVEGHHRALALQMLKDRGRIYDAPCKVFPQVPKMFIRKHGFDPEDYKTIYEEENQLMDLLAEY